QGGKPKGARRVRQALRETGRMTAALASGARAAAISCLILAAACSKGGGEVHEAGDDSKPGPDGAPVFRDVTAATGILFRHTNSATGARYMPEAMGSGVAVIDYDGDGRQDLYFVDSGSMPRAGAPAR